MTGRVAHVKAEEDGDLHIELRDAFGWSDQTFPFDTRTGHRLHLQESPVVTVVGMAFYDAKHRGSRPNRRDASEPTAVWEVHPVMVLSILAAGGHW